MDYNANNGNNLPMDYNAYNGNNLVCCPAPSFSLDFFYFPSKNNNYKILNEFQFGGVPSLNSSKLP